MPELDDAALERRLRGSCRSTWARCRSTSPSTIDRRREARGVARRSARGRGITCLRRQPCCSSAGRWRRAPASCGCRPSSRLSLNHRSIAVATASPDATSPSPTPSVRPSLGPPPSDPIGPLAWTQERLEEDWPAPVREEPAGGAAVLQIRHDEAHTFEWDQYRDPTGDTGSDVHPWADIRWVEFCDEACLIIGRESDEFFGRGGAPPDVDPSEQWIASGVVADTDGDGIGDWRYGIDNAFVGGCGGGRPSLRIDLHTGRTE